jgi:outer membrane receptor protein involved in Fe transport
MTRSRKRKLRRLNAAWAGVPLATSILASAPAALAQQQEETGVLEEVVVTAQKREENLQKVPLSITAISNEKLEELHITRFEDYARLIPSVSFQNPGPGFAKVYMRGVANGGDGNHSGSLPSVGMYLDEQPVTTIQGNLDIHLYDIARVEALAGPQGTLYGASSQAGTIRIITNKPDPSGFKAGYDLQGNAIASGSSGYTAEGFANIPISDRAAVRLVGWAEHTPGYIDNVAGTRTYPTSGICISNTSPPAPDCVSTPMHAKKDYNDVDTYGARAALKIDLNDNWTITPTFMGQKQKANGFFGYDPSKGDLKIAHFYPESSDDRWGQVALTVEGKFANFDLVYAGAFLKRNVDSFSDYTDYSYYYDVFSGYGSYFYDNAGALINPSQVIHGKDRYQKYSHELRISSPQDKPFRVVAGVFMQRQQHGIEQRYVVDGLATTEGVTGWPDTWWLTEQLRVDRDYAFFTEMNYDITDKLTATGGIRFFKAKNSLEGFFGFGLTQEFSSTGEQQCFSTKQVNGGPCENLDKEVNETGNTPKLSLSYKFDDDHMAYVTWSKGFRPGGVNRYGTLPPYKADFLTNYELGWKTTWAGGRVRFNGALFLEDWKDFQFSFLGLNSLTEIANASNARIKGIELEMDWAATDRLRLTGGLSLIHSELLENYCDTLDPVTGEAFHGDVCPTFDDPPTAPPAASKGSELPITPKFKANLSGRYAFQLGSFDAHVQGAFAYVGKRQPELRTLQSGILGEMPAYFTADFTAGIEKQSWSAELYINNAFDKRAQLDRFAQCDATVCGIEGHYVNVVTPREIGIQFGQKF